MRRLYIVCFFLVILSPAFAQVEICNNGLDDDFDGFIDCYDGSCANSPLCDGIFLGNDAACKAVPPAFPQFTMTLDFASPNESTNHLARMAVGDLNRDGIPEIVTMNRYNRKLLILNGNDGKVQKEVNAGFEPYWEIAIANLDNDNCGEIIYMGWVDLPGTSSDGIYLMAYDCQLNFLWRSSTKMYDDPGNFGIADFDGDGQEEIYARDEIFDAKTGVRLVKSAATGTNSYNRINGGPVAADILGDKKLELISGLKIYSVNLGARTADAGSLTLLDSRAEFFTRNNFNATSIADYNLDGFLDVLASGSTVAHGTNTTVFFWDVKNNTLKTYSDPQPALGSDYTNGWKNGTGRLNIADLDGDGTLNASFVSGRFLYALDQNFNLLWRVTINEETSGYTGCTLFDFNGDGKSEIVYRDERFLYIINGNNGTIFSQQNCISRTNREYPIVADVDADGSTELCVTCGYKDANAWANFSNLDSSRYSHVRVFKSAAEPWVPARRVWNQHGYFVVNVNDDLTIPTQLQQHQLVFSTGNCTQGPNRPLNKFLNQSPYLNSEGCPTYAAPDIAFLVAPTVKPPTCPDLDFKVSFKLTNKGDVALTGNIPVSFYTSDPLQAGATKLATINIAVNNLSSGDIVSIDDQVITGIGSQYVYVVLNDAGTTVPTPIVLPNTGFIECDYDNIRFAEIKPLPAPIQAEQLTPNDDCNGPNNGAAKAFVPINGAENTANNANYNFYWSNGTVGKPIASADYVGPVYSGIPAGTYTVYARHKVANCNSDTTQVVIGSTTPTFPQITMTTLSDQTKCSPFNGKLQVSIAGNPGGYQIQWKDEGGNLLPITGPVASNLQAGSYTAIVSRGTCNVSIPATVNPPNVPDAQASVVQNVVDCSNPNSGSITATALVSGVAQDPANYTFTWYKYDNTNSTQGSVLGPGNGSGPTRTSLPVGFYLVEVKENTSQCPSTIKPIVEIKSQFVFPDPPQIQILASQTSCDPLAPNGIMTANVFVGGIQQDPANFTFEWFKGQTTQPTSKVTTVSDINGKTVNNVAAGGIPYTVKVTNSFNCSATSDKAITENLIAPVVTLSQLTPNTICNPANTTPFNDYNGSLTASVTFDGNTITLPNANYEFEWRRPDNSLIIVADKTNPVLSKLVDGNSYSVTVKRKDLGCVSSPDTEPVLPAKVLPALDTDSEGSNTCVGAAMPDGSVTVNVTNPLPGQSFGYTWYTGNVASGPVLSNSQTVQNLGGAVGSPHPFTVVVLNNATGCQNSATEFVVDESVVPVISFTAIVSNKNCAAPFDGSLTAQINNQVGAITDYVFNWTSPGPPPYASSGNGLNSITGLKHGVYTLQVTNPTTNCTSTPINVPVPDGTITPAITFDSNGSYSCASGTPDGDITAQVTNGGTSFTYAWSAVAPAPGLTASNFVPGQPEKLVKVGGFTNGAPPNSYQVIVTNTVTKCSNTAVGQVADLSQKPTLTLVPNPNDVCSLAVPDGPTQYTGSLTVTSVNHPKLSGTISYAWFNATPAGVPIPGAIPSQTSMTLPNRGAGKYGVQVTIDNLGCSSEIIVDEVLDQLAPLVIDANTSADLNCVGDNGTAQVNSVDGNPVAGYLLSWYNGPVVAGAPFSTNPVLSNLPGSSTYTVQAVSLSDGCTSTKTLTVNDGRVIPTADINFIQPNTKCTGAPNGELRAIATNAGSNFTFTWSPGTGTGANGFINAGLAAGSYDVYVTDNTTGCQSPIDTETILDDFTYPDIVLQVDPQSACVGTNGAVIANDPAPGTRTFAWFTGNVAAPAFSLATDPGETNRIDDLAAGNYTVEVTITATGCSATQSTRVSTLIVPPTLALTNTQAVTICGPSPSTFTPNGAASTTLGAITNDPVTSSPDFTVFYVRTPVINGVGAGTFPTDPAVVKASAETYDGGPNPPSINNLAPGYLTALVIDNVTGCESPVETVAIADNTSNYQIDIVGLAVAGLCNPLNPGGSINVDVLKNGAPCTTCNYEWYDGTPTNSNINFFNNPPNMTGSTLIATVQDLGVTSPAGGVSAGDYTLIVKDALNGCGAFEIENIPTADPATVAVNPTQPTLCVNAINPTNNGQIQVDVDKFLPNVNGYTVNIFAGNAATGMPLVSTTNNNPADNSFSVTLSNLNSGDYFVQVVDLVPANTGCPQGFQVTLLSKAFNPKVATLAAGSTTCDPANFSDGSVQVTVTKDAADQSADQDYRIAQITPQPRVPVAANTLIGNGNSGQSITLNTFRPQTVQPNYVIRVIDAISSCFTDVNVAVPNAEDVPGPITVSPIHDTNCANAALNNSNGGALADLTDPADAENLFTFVWDNNSSLASPVLTAVGNLLNTGGQLLNQGKVAAADWAMGPVGQGNPSRTFYVQAEKNSGPGRACKSQIVEVTILDKHKDPNLTIASTFDTFCTATAMNLVKGDGTISIIADADPTTPAQDIPAGGFAYDWDPVPTGSAVTPVNVSTAPTYSINQLGDGTYNLTVRNTQNECITQNAATVAPAPFVLEIVSAAVNDQRICTNDGQIQLTSINVRNQTANTVVQNNAGAAIDALYDFKWYIDPTLTAGNELTDGTTMIDTRTLSHDTDGDLIVENGDYPGMQAGTYYVVGTRDANASLAAGCPTQPFTVIVNDAHKNPTIALTPFSNTSCLTGPGTGEGIIQVNITDTTPLSYNLGNPFVYSYDWDVLSDSPANNGNGSSSDGDFDRIEDLLEGSYTVIVTNPSTSCASTATTEIQKNATPIFVTNVDPDDELICEPIGDGRLRVVSVVLKDRQNVEEVFDGPLEPGTGNISDFQFEWTRNGAGPQITAGTILDRNNYSTAALGGAAIGAGTYTVVARRISATDPDDVGRGCSSAPFTVEILDRKVNPIVSLTPLPNTGCGSFAEGKIEVRVSDQTLVPGPHTYTYTWDPANPTAITQTSGNNGNGSSADGDGDRPGNLLHNPSGNEYIVSVKNEQSGCVSTASTIIYQNSTPIIIPSVTPTPQVRCLPPDGKLQVSSVEVLGISAPLTDFTFEWSQGALGTVPTVIPGQTSAVLSNILADQYYVRAIRINGVGGRGCPSAPFPKAVPDARLFPELSFEQVANSSCLPINPNGEVTAHARELDGSSTATYNFSWSFNSSPVVATAVDANSSRVSNASDGDYLVTATNTVTGCPVTSLVNLTLDQTRSTPNVIGVIPTDPQDCKPTGSALVTEIKVGVNGALIDDAIGLGAFNYEWYQGSVNPSNQLPAGGPFVTTREITNIPVGIYFVVVRDPATNCPSPGREVIISPDDIVYPDLNIQQTALQISCIEGIGSAELSVTADNGQTGLPYTFQWFANATGSGVAIDNDATLSGIPAGTYSVTVYNSATECSTSDSYIVEDDTEEFKPVISMSSQPRTLCVGTDGEVTARIINLSPLYPYRPFTANTFTADLYFSATPDLSAAPDIAAIPANTGLVGSFTEGPLNEGFYTVRIRDNNTGCFSTATEEIKLQQTKPTVVVDELSPVTNCDPVRANGMAQATADGAFKGFTFDWFEGASASGSAVYTGPQFSELKMKPQQYTVRATNLVTGCFTDVVTDIEDATVPVPAATIEVLSHVTSCVISNGALMAYVGEDKNTSNYIFHWYDGSVENPPADNIGETYTQLAAGNYSVTATSIVTGCKSPLTVGEVLDKQEYPDFEFVIQNTTCDKQDGFATLVMISNTPVETIEWSNSEGAFLTGPNFMDAGAGQYQVTATTFFGCKTTKDFEIKPDIRPYNGISRNNDGQNEIFQIDCIQNFPSNVVKIFNRAGTLVYEAEGYDNFSTYFDGRSNKGISPMGVSLPDGTYFYIVDKRDGTKPIAGYLEIVK